MWYLRLKVCLERRWHVECGPVHWGALGESPGGAINPLQWQERAVWPGSSLVTSGVGLHQQKFAQTSVRAGGAMAICRIPDPWFTEVGEKGLI